MDELQLTWNGEKLLLWGVSSDKGEQFTPRYRLEKIFKVLFPSAVISFLKQHIDIPSNENIIIVSHSLKLAYEQYDTQKPSIKKMQVDAVEVELPSLIDGFLLSQKQSGFYFGDSYDGYKYLVKFAYNLVVRQRFTPYYKDDKSFFLANLDSNEDFTLFKELCEELPNAIKARYDLEKEKTIEEFLNCFVDVLVREMIRDVNIKMESATKSDKWVLSFFNDELTVDSMLKHDISSWLVSRNVSRMHDYALLFKLNEPIENGATWSLQYAVQSKKDPSLIIGLEEIWNNNKSLPISGYKLHIIQELGMAARYAKSIEKSMLKRNPTEAIFSEEEALSFMKTDSFMLRDFGFVVQIPKITPTKLDSLRVVIKPKMQKILKTTSTSGLSDSLFDFDYEVAIGDDIVLSSAEFHKLSSIKSNLVKVKDKWVELNNDDVKKVLSYFEKKKQLSLSEVIYTNATGDVEFEIVGEAFHDTVADGFLNPEKLGTQNTPANFCGELREYQKKGYTWLTLLRSLKFGGILADDMGLGKTIQAISYLLYLQTQTVEKPTLIVAPTSVIGNWERELARFAPTLSVCLYHGVSRKKNDIVKQIERKDIVITSYGTLRNDMEVIGDVVWGSIILDEAQNIKNHYTKQAKAVAKLSSPHRLCLTGTPIENRLSELWALLNFLNPGILSSWEKFKTNFATPIELDGCPKKTERLKKIISPFILRRLKTDKSIINDLPEKTEIKEYCTLTEEQATLYQAILNESMEKIKASPEDRRMHILAAIIKLKQVCNHPTNLLKDTKTKLLGRSGKLEKLCDMVDVFLENNEKCLIFTQFKEMGDILKQTLEVYTEEPVLFLHGQTSRKKRECMINLFQNENMPRIFILSLKAGGVGVNLTAASKVIHFDRWWNPAVENQATDRVHRIGQKKNVFIYKYITSGTIEEKIDEIIESKRALSESLLAKGEIVLTELDDEALKEIFSLRRESFA